MTDVFNLIFAGITEMYDLLSQVDILGVNLFTFFIVLTLVGVMVPILINYVRAGSERGGSREK